jgi:hypothetical protein
MTGSIGASESREATAESDPKLAKMVEAPEVLARLGVEGVHARALGTDPERWNYRFGVMLLRRPLVAELEHGMRASDYVLSSPTAYTNPLPSDAPDAVDLFGEDDLHARVTSLPPGQEDLALYGDANAVINRLSSGTANAWERLGMDQLSWNKLSPTAKRMVGGAAALGALFLGGKALSGMNMMSLGYRMGSDDDNDGGETRTGGGLSSPMGAAMTAQAAQLHSSPVEGEADALELRADSDAGRRAVAIPDEFFRAAYALGLRYDDRKSQPVFGAIAGDPKLQTCALRGARAPRLWVKGGRIIRTSAPYAAEFILPATSPFSGAQLPPLAGGFLAAAVTLGKTAAKAGKAIIKGIGKLFSKVGAALKRALAQGSNFGNRPVCSYASAIPVYLGILQQAGKIPAEVWEDAWKDYQELYENVEANIPSGKRSKAHYSEGYRRFVSQRVQNFLDRWEAKRRAYGIVAEHPFNDGDGSAAPGERPWSDDMVKDRRKWEAYYQAAQARLWGLVRSIAPGLYDKVYIARVAPGSPSYYDTFGTRNPLWPIKDEAELADGAKEMAEVERSAAVPLESVTGPGGTVLNMNARPADGGMSAAQVGEFARQVLGSLRDASPSPSEVGDVPMSWIDSEGGYPEKQQDRDRLAITLGDNLIGDPVLGGSPRVVAEMLKLVPRFMKALRASRFAPWLTKTKLLVGQIGVKGAGLWKRLSVVRTGLGAAFSGVVKMLKSVGSSSWAFIKAFPRLAFTAALSGLLYAMGSAGAETEMQEVITALKHALDEMLRDGDITQDVHDAWQEFLNAKSTMDGPKVLESDPVASGDPAEDNSALAERSDSSPSLGGMSADQLTVYQQIWLAVAIWLAKLQQEDPERVSSDAMLSLLRDCLSGVQSIAVEQASEEEKEALELIAQGFENAVSEESSAPDALVSAEVKSTEAMGQMQRPKSGIPDSARVAIAAAGGRVIDDRPSASESGPSEDPEPDVSARASDSSMDAAPENAEQWLSDEAMLMAAAADDPQASEAAKTELREKLLMWGVPAAAVASIVATVVALSQRVRKGQLTDATGERSEAGMSLWASLVPVDRWGSDRGVTRVVL